MNNILKKYAKLWYEGNYLKELVGAALSRLGDGVDTIAFAILVYHITGSTLLVATLFAVNGLPNLIFGIVSGVVSTHRDEKRIMVLCDYGRGLCALLTAILFLLGILQSWHLYVITFLNSSFEAFRAPASTSIFPKIISEDLRDDGIALKTSVTRVTELLGLAVAPAIIAFLGLQGALFFNAATFLVCGFCVSLIKVDKKESSKMSFRGSIDEVKGGFVYVKAHSKVLGICIFTCIINIVFIPVNVFQVPYVEDILHGSEIMLSIMGISASLSMAVSAIVMPSIKEKLGNKVSLLGGGILISAAYFVMVVLAGQSTWIVYIGLALGMAMLGIGLTMANFVVQIIFFDEIEQDYLARVSAISSMFALCIVPLFSSLSGVLLNYISLSALFIGCAVFSLVVFAVNYIKGLCA